MILEREQINRYLRHIIIPEISGPGQKRLLDASILVWGENAECAAPILYYLAASGIGRINCHFEDASGFEKLSASIRDLNTDVTVELSDEGSCGVKILTGSPEFFIKNRHAALSDFVPTIISLYREWNGGIGVFNDSNDMDMFLSKLEDAHAALMYSSAHEMQGSILSYCFSGALCAVEALKLSLNIGEKSGGFLYFDLLSMEFSKTGIHEPICMMDRICSPHNIDPPHVNPGRGKVLIAGAGGLGSPAAYALSLMGIGTLGLVDYDAVDISNLNRQILHSTSRIGMPKTESAEIFLKTINPHINLKKYNTGLNRDNVFEILQEYDAVICAVDNFPARFLLNDACFFAGKPMIDAGVLRFDGTCMTITPKAGPCYRCLLPDIPSPGSTPSCSESGVLGPVPGVMGFIQAAETIKLLCGIGSNLIGRIIFYEGLSFNIQAIKLNRNNYCKLCGDEPSINRLQDYPFACGATIDEDGNRQD